MRPVSNCLLMSFQLLTLHQLIIQLKINLLILLKEPSMEKALLTLHVTTETHFFTVEILKNIMHGLVIMYMMRQSFCWTIFLFDLAPYCIDE